MATEVLRPQDVLAERFRVHPTSSHRQRILPESGNLTNLVVNRKQHRKTSPPKPVKRRFSASAAEAKRSSDHHGGVPNPRPRVEITSGGGSLAMGQVTLLRRGESLSSIASPTAGGNPSDPIRKPIDDLSVPKQIRQMAGPPADIYAGSAFSMSPSPRSVPLPSFYYKKDSNDGATRDLRRLLRLE